MRDTNKKTKGLAKMKIDELKNGAIYAIIDAPTKEQTMVRVTKERVLDSNNRRLPIVKTYQGKELIIPQRKIRLADGNEVEQFILAIRLVKQNEQNAAAQVMDAMHEAINTIDI